MKSECPCAARPRGLLDASIDGRPLRLDTFPQTLSAGAYKCMNPLPLPLLLLPQSPPTHVRGRRPQQIRGPKSQSMNRTVGIVCAHTQGRQRRGEEESHPDATGCLGVPPALLKSKPISISISISFSPIVLAHGDGLSDDGALPPNWATTHDMRRVEAR